MTSALTGGTVLTSLSPPRVLQGDVVFEGSTIVDVGEAPPDANRRDCSGCLIVPGNVCAHMHLYSALARGMPFSLDPPTNFVQILQRVWWRLDRALDLDTIRVSALLGGMEALLSGTTTLIDHHASPNAIDGSLDVIADTLEELGIRSVLCYEVTNRDGPERADAGLDENRRFLKAASGRTLTRGMVGAHASFTLSEETLGACVEIGDEAGAGLHIHVAEDQADQVDSEARFGRRVVDRLAGARALTDATLLAHCVHLNDAEMETVRGSGATVAHNPRSNMNNGVGRAPIRGLGGRVALGTDGIGSDMFAESQAGFWRLREDDLAAGPDWCLKRLIEGARFIRPLFGGQPFGRLEAEAPADLVVLDYRSPTPLESENVAGHWAFGLSSKDVRDVMVGGELVVADRRLTRVDQDKIPELAAKAAERLWSRLEDIGPHPFEPAGAA
jgi:putative selenium metabolism protein SsnA